MAAFPIALAQINVTVGDIDGNVAKILAFHEKAAASGAQLVVFGELALIGYPPEDLVLMPELRARAKAAMERLARATAGKPAMIVGSVWEGPLPTPLPCTGEGSAVGVGEGIFNAAFLLDDGKIAHVQPKTKLPNYGVFDERRIFSGGEGQVTEWRGHKLGILVCEDTWSPAPAQSLAEQGAELLISINASPFEAGKHEQRIKIVSDAVRNTGLPLAYVNLVGGQDDIVFDGGSFMMDASGKITAQAPQFEEALVGQKVDGGWWMVDGDKKDFSTNHQLWSAMQLGLRDYVEKNHFPGVVLGLSGGIDSALTAVCAVDALGKDRVHGVLLPSPYTSKESVEDALLLAKNLGIETMTVPIAPGMQTMEEVLSPVFHDAKWMEDVAVGGNLQARLRGLALMAISNKFGWLLLSTGNKSEIAVGYTTLYGDSCGGYNVLKDVYKTTIYALAGWRNSQDAVIPARSIAKAPSAELAPGQTDQDQLPPYETLDAILALHIEGRKSAAEIIAAGFDKATVEKVVRLVRGSEFKRRQSAPGVKLTSMMFGKERRYPLTNKF